jgi:hypothetical protein
MFVSGIAFVVKAVIFADNEPEVFGDVFHSRCPPPTNGKIF